MEAFKTGRWSWARRNAIDTVTEHCVGVVIAANLEFIKAVDWLPLAEVVIETHFASVTHFSLSLKQEMFYHSEMIATAHIKLALYDLKAKVARRIRIENGQLVM